MHPVYVLREEPAYPGKRVFCDALGQAFIDMGDSRVNVTLGEETAARLSTRDAVLLMHVGDYGDNGNGLFLNEYTGDTAYLPPAHESLVFVRKANGLNEQAARNHGTKLTEGEEWQLWKMPGEVTIFGLYTPETVHVIRRGGQYQMPLRALQGDL